MLYIYYLPVSVSNIIISMMSLPVSVSDAIGCLPVMSLSVHYVSDIIAGLYDDVMS